MQLVPPRGPFSAALLAALSGQDDGAADALAAQARRSVDSSPDLVLDDDVQLGLHLLYELHYGGLPGVPDELEWSLPLLAARAVVERAFEADLRRRFWAPPAAAGVGSGDVARRLFDLARDGGSASGSVAGHVARHATVGQVAEVLVLRSPYQLKEADPQTWALPRLSGRPKAALVEILADEYGGGRVDRMHARLFARCMAALGLDDTPNAYLDHVPAAALASANVISLFGLHRRLRGALCGHLTLVEMTSSLPSKRWVSGLERLGLGTDATEFFDEHVEADALHEQIAAHDLCGTLAADEPHLLDDILFGAAVCIGMDDLTTDLALDAWRAGGTALRRRLPTPATAGAGASGP